MKVKSKTIVFSKTSLLILVVVLIISSCEDLVEKDITDSELILVAPGDNLRTPYSTQTFWWEEFEGARAYTLQVVSPSFESIELIFADTTITKNKFTLNLLPGKFEWRVKAQNGYYSGKYSTRTLQIDSTLDMKGQKVSLISPAEDSYLNSRSILLTWQKLYNADTYNIEVHKINWTGDLAFYFMAIKYDSITINSLFEGDYVWGIKALNRNSSTDFTTRKITIDRTVPGLPTLIEPKDKANLLNLPANLTWNRIPDTGAPVKDSVLISTDSLFNPNKIIVSKLLADSKLDNAVQDTGTYYWKVKSVDAAGNQSQFSVKRRFKVLSK
jgi:hypothetical protein